MNFRKAKLKIMITKRIKILFVSVADSNMDCKTKIPQAKVNKIANATAKVSKEQSIA